MATSTLNLPSTISAERPGPETEAPRSEPTGTALPMLAPMSAATIAAATSEELLVAVGLPARPPRGPVGWETVSRHGSGRPSRPARTSRRPPLCRLSSPARQSCTGFGQGGSREAGAQRGSGAMPEKAF